MSCRWFSMEACVLSTFFVVLGCARVEEPGPTEQGVRQLSPDEEGEISDPSTYYNRTLAIIVGIDEYSGGGWKQLKRAASDARAVHYILRQEFGYDDDNIKLLLDDQATLAEIKDALTSWLRQKDLQPDDSILVFFAGHGERGYLIPSDGVKANIHSTAVSMDWIKRQLSASMVPCRHRMVILDSCYSGSLFQQENPVIAASENERESSRPALSSDEFRGSGRHEDTLAAYIQGRSFLGISAGRDTVVVDELGEGNHSLFTSMLLKVLEERANSSRPDHVFFGSRLATEVEERVANARASGQRPKWGHLQPGDGDFIFRPTTRRSTPREISEDRRRKLKVRTYVRELTSAKESIDRGDSRAALRILEQQLQDSELRKRFEGRFLSLLAKGGSGKAVQVLGEEGTQIFSVSSDGRRILISRDEGTSLYNTSDGKKLKEVSGVKSAFVANGSQFITADSKSGTLWSTATGRRLSTHPEIKITENIRGSLVCSLDSETLLVQRSSEVAVYDAITLGKRFVIGDKAVSSQRFGPVAVAADSSVVAVTAYEPENKPKSFEDVFTLDTNPQFYPGSINGAVLVYDAHSGKELGRIDIGALHASDLEFSPDAFQLAVAFSDVGVFVKEIKPATRNVQIWNTRSFELEQTIQGFSNGNTAVAFSPDGATLAVGGCPNPDLNPLAPMQEWKAFVSFFDLWTGQEIFSFQANSCERSYDMPTVGELRFLPDNSSLLVNAGTVQLWRTSSSTFDDKGSEELLEDSPQKPDEVADQPARRRFPGRIMSLGKLGHTLVTRRNDRQREPFQILQIWDIENRNIIQEFERVGSNGLAILSPDEKRLLFNQSRRSWVIQSLEEGTPPIRIGDRKTEVALAVFSADSRIVATTGYHEKEKEFAVTLWDASSGREVRSLVLAEPLDAMALAPTASLLATYGFDNRLRIWNTSNQEPTNETPFEPTAAMAFSPGGKELATGGWQLNVHNLENSMRVKHSNVLGGDVSCVEFNALGTQIACGYKDGRVAVVELDSLEVSQIFSGIHRGPIVGLAFRDENTLVTASEDGNIGIWVLNTKAN